MCSKLFQYNQDWKLLLDCISSNNCCNSSSVKRGLSKLGINALLSSEVSGNKLAKAASSKLWNRLVNNKLNK